MGKITKEELGDGLRFTVESIGNMTNVPTTSKNVEGAITELHYDFAVHLADNANPHAVTKSQVGLGSVDNVKQMPIAGGTFTGAALAQNNINYTTAQVRNVILSTADPTGGGNGDIWIKYKA